MSGEPAEDLGGWGDGRLGLGEARAEARRIARELRDGLRRAGAGHGGAGELEGRVSKTFAVTGIPTIRVANGSGAIRIAVGAPGRVVVDARTYVGGVGAERARQLLDAFELTLEQEGDTIIVKPAASEQERSPRDLLRGGRVAVDFDITVPSECAVDASSTSGLVSLSGVRGPAAIQNVSGETALTDHQGPLRLRTVSGDLRIATYAGHCECNSVSGDIVVTGARLRAADLQTVSGDLTVDGTLEADGGHRVRTVSGDVTLALADESFQVDYRTMSGDLVCERPARIAREARRDRLVVVGDGLVRVQAKTVSGDLRVVAAESTPSATPPAPAPAATAPSARDVLDRLASGALAEDAAAASLESLRGDGRATTADGRGVLGLVARRVVSVDQAYSLLRALGDAPDPASEPAATAAGQAGAPQPGAAPQSGAAPRGRTLRIRVTEGGSQKVNVAIPVAIARVGKMKLGGLVRGHLGRFGIDLDEVVRRADQTGRLIDIADGQNRVEIFVE